MVKTKFISKFLNAVIMRRVLLILAWIAIIILVYWSVTLVFYGLCLDIYESFCFIINTDNRFLSLFFNNKNNYNNNINYSKQYSCLNSNYYNKNVGFYFIRYLVFGNKPLNFSFSSKVLVRSIAGLITAKEKEEEKILEKEKEKEKELINLEKRENKDLSLVYERLDKYDSLVDLFKSKNLQSSREESHLLSQRVLPIESMKSIYNLVKKESVDYLEIYIEIEKILKILKSINNKGFINDMDLINYPIIGECIDKFLLKPEKAYFIKDNEKDLDLIKSKWMNISTSNDFFWLTKNALLDRLKNASKNTDFKVGEDVYLGREIFRTPLDDIDLGRRFISTKEAKEFYKWSFNVIILNLLTFTEELILKIEKEKDEVNILDNDMLTDYKTLSKDLLHKLDPSLRAKIAKKGFSVNQNIYTGFDTEYVNLNSLTNKLLSVQLSVCSRTLLEMPLNSHFNFREIDVLSGKEYDKTKNNPYCMESELLRTFIQNSIERIRVIKYGDLDKHLKHLIKGLKDLIKNPNITTKLKIVNFIEKDNSIIFVFDRSPFKQYFEACDSFRLKDIVRISYQFVEESLRNDWVLITQMLEELFKESKVKKDDEVRVHKEVVDETVIDLDDIKNDLVEKALKTETLLNKIVLKERSILNKKYTRTNNTSYTDSVINITKKVNNYLISHYTPSDLSGLEDFEEFKMQIDIVNKSFVTLRKPILIDGINVNIRDTLLIAPGGKKSLDAISSLYEAVDVKKVKISSDKIKHMDKFLKEDPDLFRQYALQDSLIALVHGCFMEDFVINLGGTGVPLTLSGLSGRYIRKFWKDKNYSGYQVDNQYLMTNVSKTITPKGLSVVKDAGVKSSMYIANYKGGRNESFMYGFENIKKWFDYDLISAYTSAMLLLGTPDYKNARVLTGKEFKDLKWSEKINSYTVLNVSFKFPEDTKYPSIPCHVDEVTTAYPLKGESMITSLDYLVAEKQKAKIEIKDVYYTPFLERTERVQDSSGKWVRVKVLCKPFYECIKELQRLRAKYPKGTINNALFKEIANSLYGLIVKGINEKLKFDARTGEMKRMEGNDLSNPLIACWITSFVRCVIGELLHSVQLLDGKVVSVTTDGFITDIEDLESKVSNLKSYDKSLYREYRKARNSDILELKTSGIGIMSWSTRGQLSENAKLLAATGFQRGKLSIPVKSISEIKELFEKAILADKELVFLQAQLRSGKDIFKKGGHVTEILSDRVFRLMYDNKRFIIEKEGETLYDSKPLNTISEGSLLRYISKVPKTSLYSKNMSNSTSGKYKNKLDLVIRNFIRGLMNNLCNLDNSYFNNYMDIVKYLKEYDSSVSVSVNSISQLKRRGVFCKTPKTLEGLAFVEYVKLKFPNFDDTEFFLSNESNKMIKSENHIDSNLIKKNE